MPRSVQKYLYDIREACDLLTRFTIDKTLDDYLGDALLRSGVERQFMVIGEALSQALRIDPALATKVSNISRIIGFRNQLIHGYPDILHETVWGVLHGSLPTLRAEVDRLLETTH